MEGSVGDSERAEGASGTEARSVRGDEPTASSSSSAHNPPDGGPSLLGMAASVTRSAVKFAASGFKTVGQEAHRTRIETCSSCQYYNGSRCHVCGCFVDKKAWLPHEDCPLGKWPV